MTLIRTRATDGREIKLEGGEIGSARKIISVTKGIPRRRSRTK